MYMYIYMYRYVYIIYELYIIYVYICIYILYRERMIHAMITSISLGSLESISKVVN